MGRLTIRLNPYYIDSRGYSSILDVQSSRGTDFDTNHCMVVANVRERLAVSKQSAQKFDVEKYNLKLPSELQVRKQYQIKISNRCAVFKNLNDSKNPNGA